MNRYHLPIICLIVSSAVSAAYSQEASTNDWHPRIRLLNFQEGSTNSWRPNTRLLDIFARQHDPLTGDAGSTLAHDVKQFYQLLRDKKWHKTYEMRAKVFRKDMPETDYLATAIRSEKLWGLVNYEVLAISIGNSYGSTNADEAVLICKFIELPDYADSYSTVYWHKEEGVWKCLTAGPFKLDIFKATRAPIIDWR